MSPRLEIIGIQGLPEVCPGDDLAQLIRSALREQSLPLHPHDILVISQKIVSKAEGRLVRLAEVLPSPVATSVARTLGRDPRLIEVILQETRRIVRMDRGILITETKQGMICANAGVDQSNVDAGVVSLLPEDPDRSASQLRQELKRLTGLFVGVIISDTFGRPWREGLTNIAVGLSGIAPLKSYLGEKDPAGHILQATILAVVDELAGAAELVMGKLERVPVALVRGYPLDNDQGTGRDLLRPPERDLFR
jgi:coenzyme F420-0:L-glutamate ligase/coenzyme F420-1:gamma-L-glutamate ligase